MSEREEVSSVQPQSTTEARPHLIVDVITTTVYFCVEIIRAVYRFVRPPKGKSLETEVILITGGG